MIESDMISAYILLLLGLYLLMVSIGEIREQGLWEKTLESFIDNPSTRILTGFTVFSIGSAIFLVNPWEPQDWLSIAVTVLGAWMAVKGALLLALGDRMLALARPMMANGNRLWLALSGFLGIGALVIAGVRIAGA